MSAVDLQVGKNAVQERTPRRVDVNGKIHNAARGEHSVDLVEHTCGRMNMVDHVVNDDQREMVVGEREFLASSAHVRDSRIPELGEFRRASVEVLKGIDCVTLSPSECADDSNWPATDFKDA